MLDTDLAQIYGYEVKRLLNVTANINSKSRALPYAFTEQGIYMLATVLRGELAEQQSIFIKRAFLVTARVSERSIQMASMSDRQKKTEQNVRDIQKSP